GSGKTTTSAKLAKYLSAQKQKVLLASLDTHRPAAQEQLAVLAPQHFDQRIVHNFNDLLRRVDCLNNILTNRPLLCFFQKIFQGRQGHIGLQQRDAHLAQGGGHVGLGQGAASTQAIKNAAQPLC
ncbi:MAG: hypothetical protein EBZ69_06180, partial [Alphaproteobacteria bacterium]|nr:hypothetical protein [Alphaproteobacteria bacterium]